MAKNKDIYIPKDKELGVARDLIDEEYYLDAIKILQKLNKSKSSSYSIKFALALAWATSGISIDRAEKYFRKLINSDWRMANAARIELGRLLLCKKEYEEAKENFEIAAKDKKTGLYALSELVYLFIRTEDYEKAKKIYDETTVDNRYWGSSINTQIETYLGHKLGNITDLTKFKNYYFGLQLLDYSEDRAIEHIKYHLDENDNKTIHSIYLDDADVEEIYNNSKIRITSVNPSTINIVDKYVLSFDKTIGIINQEETDTVSVVTFPNTYDILSIYPIHNPKTRVKK